MIEVDPKLVHIASSLNPEQRYAYNEILSVIETVNGGVFFSRWAWRYMKDLSIQGIAW
jgi:hypothetical protein